MRVREKEETNRQTTKIARKTNIKRRETVRRRNKNKEGLTIGRDKQTNRQIDLKKDTTQIRYFWS